MWAAPHWAWPQTPCSWDKWKNLTFEGYLPITLPAASCSLKEGSSPSLPQASSPVWAQIQSWAFSYKLPFSPFPSSLIRFGQQEEIGEQDKRRSQGILSLSLYLGGLSSLFPVPAGKSCPLYIQHTICRPPIIPASTKWPQILGSDNTSPSACFSRLRNGAASRCHLIIITLSIGQLLRSSITSVTISLC